MGAVSCPHHGPHSQCLLPGWLREPPNWSSCCKPPHLQFLLHPEQLLKTPNMILSRTCLNTLQSFFIGLRSKILHEGPLTPSLTSHHLLVRPQAPAPPVSSQFLQYVLPPPAPGPLHMLSQLAVGSSPDSSLATFCSAFYPQLKYLLPQEASPESHVAVVVSVSAPSFLAWHLFQSVIIR